ncbi:MAG: ABC transporter ATP-binding protein [Treponema sp.]|nr:ABC transporter ATP-binding protein [Treponema sp.]
MIELINFSKRYSGKKKAVEDVSFVARPATITALLGPNGAGKTTILKAICGLHAPSEGCVKVCGEEDMVQLKKITGFVPETPLLPENFMVKEFVRFNAELHGLYGEEASKALLKVKKDCSLADVWESKIAALSKGYRQRVSFAAALVHNPEVLVLDEPASGLDPAQINHLRSFILKLGKEKTILLSTHLMQEVYALCSYICIISKGKLVASGTAEEIIKKENVDSLETAFLRLTDSEA